MNGGGDSSFIIHHSSFLLARYANRQSGQAQTLVSVGSTPTCATDWVVLLAAACKAVVAKQAGWATRGSIPSQLTELDMARSSNGRIPGPQPGDAGSIPVRAARHDEVVKLVDTRRSERRADRGVGVRLSPSSLVLQAWQVLSRPS